MTRLFLLAALLTAPALAVAQPGSATRIGLGVRIGTVPFLYDETGDLSLFGAPRVSVPVDVNGVVRIEPEIGIASTSFSSGSDEQTTRQTALGVAVSALVPREDLTLTVGGRLRYLRSTFAYSFGPDDRETTGVTFAIGPLIGGEYPFSDRFALGAEVGLEYRAYTLDYSFSGNTSNDDGRSGYGTTAALSARFFF